MSKRFLGSGFSPFPPGTLVVACLLLMGCGVGPERRPEPEPGGEPALEWDFSFPAPDGDSHVEIEDAVPLHVLTCSPFSDPEIVREFSQWEGGEVARKSKFTEEQMVYAVKQLEAGIPIEELGRKYGVSTQTLYRWRNKYGGLAVSEVRRLKQLEEENRKLKQLVADLSLDKQILQDVVRKEL